MRSLIKLMDAQIPEWQRGVVVCTVTSQQEGSGFLCGLVYVLWVFAWVFSWYSSFLKQSKDMYVRLISDSNLPIHVNVLLFAAST